MKIKTAICLLLLFAPLSMGFTLLASKSLGSRTSGVSIESSLMPLLSEPSDTSADWDDEIVNIESTSAVAADGESDTTLKTLLELMPSSATAEVSSETRAAINEAIVLLEKCNPTAQPTVSPLLNGVWDLRYAGGISPEGALASPTRQFALFLYSGGYSPGLYILTILQKWLPKQVGELQNLEIAISRSQPRVEATLQFSIGGTRSSSDRNFVGTAKVVSRLETMSSVRLKESYESVSFQDLQALEIPSFLQYSRELYITYLDDDIMIARDASGIPEVLVRKEKQFSQNWGKEPSEVDDLTPPGQKS